VHLLLEATAHRAPLIHTASYTSSHTQYCTGGPYRWSLLLCFAFRGPIGQELLKETCSQSCIQRCPREPNARLRMVQEGKGTNLYGT